MPDRLPKNKTLLFIFALTFLLYGNSIKNGYAFDDHYVTVTTPDHPNNPRVQKGLKGIPEIFRTHYVEQAQQSFEYRPLVLVSFAIEYQFFKSNPHISHLINVLLYAVTCMLLYLLLLLLLKDYHPLLPLLTTLLFLVHPIHTEVVASIKCRDELLSFLFGMLSLYLVVKGVMSGRRNAIYPALLFLFLALLCKATSILFVVLIPLTLYFFAGVKPKKALWFLLLLVITFFCQKFLKQSLVGHVPKLREFAFFENPLFYEQGFLKRIPVALYTTGYYLRLLALPYPLCCYYGYNLIPMAGWGAPAVLLSAGALLLMLWYAGKTFLQKNVLSYSILVFLAGVFPFANILTPVVGIVGERFIYLASFGFCLAVAYLLLLLFKVDPRQRPAFGIRGLKRSLLAGVALILFAATVLTISRNRWWKDELTLFRHDAASFGQSCTLKYITANKLYNDVFRMPAGPERDAITREATAHFRQAVALMEEGVAKYPSDHITLNNIGTIYVNILDNPAAAQPFFNRSAVLEPGNAVAQYNVAFCYEKRQMADSAVFFYQKMVSAGTPYSPAYDRLRELYVRRQQYPQAVACDEKAVERDPTNARLRINLGNIYLLNKDTLSGIRQFEKAVELEPANTGLRTQIARFLESAGYAAEAKKLVKGD